MNSLSFVNGQGGLGAPLPGFDHYSALVAYYKAAASVGAYSSIGNKIYTSLADAEADGVVNTYAEATAATSAQTVTAVGVDGDTVDITRTDWLGNVIELGSYTKVAGDTTVTAVATAIVAAINANTYATGFSATVGSSGAYTITAPKKWGVYPNTKSVTNTIVGTLAITNVAFTGGTKSRLAIWHYQISEFFRLNPKGILYFSIKFDDSTVNTTTALFNTQLKADVIAVQSAFGSSGSFGMARQIGVLSNERTFATSTLDALQQAKDSLDALHFNCVFAYVGDISGSTLTSLPNLGVLSDNGISMLISQSGSGTGLDLINTQMAVISSLGCMLGTISAAAVSQDIAEVGAFNLSDGSECETPVFFDSAATSFASIQTGNTPSFLDNYRYVYMGKYSNKTGTYFNDSHTAIATSSDFAWIERNRVVDKVKRLQYGDVIDLLNSRIKLNSDGTISDIAISTFDAQCSIGPDQMVKDGDLSGYAIVINPAQNVVSTGKVAITTQLLPLAIGRQITITEQYVAKLS